MKVKTEHLKMKSKILYQEAYRLSGFADQSAADCWNNRLLSAKIHANSFSGLLRCWRMVCCHYRVRERPLEAETNTDWGLAVCFDTWGWASQEISDADPKHRQRNGVYTVHYMFSYHYKGINLLTRCCISGEKTVVCSLLKLRGRKH